MRYKRMPIEIESPEQMGYDSIRCNLSESSYTDAVVADVADIGADLGRLVLAYGSHAGHEGLRSLIVGAGDAGKGQRMERAAEDSRTRIEEDAGELERRKVQESAVRTSDVLLTMGAAGGLFIIATSLLEAGDELVVVTPNYATNLETPRAIGATLRYVELNFENGFALDLRAVESAITHRTKYISVTYPHNPTGVCCSHEDILALTALAKKKDVFLLMDETYRDMRFGPLPPLAAEYGEHVISISSLSKTYGLPGLRIGWIVCRNKALMETFLAAKEQIHICGSPLDEELAYRYLLRKAKHWPRIQMDIGKKFQIMKSWIEGQDDLEWVAPQGGCVCFPRIKDADTIDIDKFYTTLLAEHGTYVGPGHWFGMPRQYMRIGYGWPSMEALQEGLEAITTSIRSARVR